ncbi:hypothetical protein TrST_g1100 [Triparma strigata]|uniref:WW domain-containing protein n=1 Tax=Triparma strigata TaxID=1606541 RepID=A0A9W7AER6_9STRA|nr:hypothetical protein TrST_g1100 [Triparma strigata]
MGCANSKPPAAEEEGVGEVSTSPMAEARGHEDVEVTGIDSGDDTTSPGDDGEGGKEEGGEGEEEDSVKPLIESTQKDLSTLLGMIELKNKLNSIAETHLPKGDMSKEHFKSFKSVGEQESEAKDLDELYAEAETAMTEFAELMRKVTVESGIDPDAYPLVEGERISKDGLERKSLTVAPLKARERAAMKFNKVCDGNFKRVLDFVRCSIIAETEGQLVGVLERMLKLKVVVRLVNRFKNPVQTGIREVIMNVRVGGHLCEVQLHLAPIFKEKAAMHIFHEDFCEMLSWSSEPYGELFKRVEAIGSVGTGTGEGEGSVAKGVRDLLEEGNLERLRALADIVGREKGIGDVSCEEPLRRKIMEVLESAGVRVRRGKKKKLELLKAYFDLAYASSGIDNWAESERFYTQAKEGYDEELGPDSERAIEASCSLIVASEISDEEMIGQLWDLVERAEEALGMESSVTLDTLNSLGVKLDDNGETEAARGIFERCWEGQESALGEYHEDTLATAENLSIVYKKLGDEEKAAEFLERSLQTMSREEREKLDRARAAAAAAAASLKADQEKTAALAAAKLKKEEEKAKKEAEDLEMKNKFKRTALQKAASAAHLDDSVDAGAGAGAGAGTVEKWKAKTGGKVKAKEKEETTTAEAAPRSGEEFWDSAKKRIKWARAFSDDYNREYYINQETQEAVWEKPADFDGE